MNVLGSCVPYGKKNYKTGDGLDFRIFRVNSMFKGSIILGTLFRRTKGEKG